jgi:hypothetical protein
MKSLAMHQNSEEPVITMNHIFKSLWYISILGAFAFAADQTWTGQISDSMCGANHSQMIATKNKELRVSSGAPERDCTLACVKDSGKYVFIRPGKVYKLANQNFAGIAMHAGETVRLTGDLQGDVITVSKIAVVPKQ